MAWQTFRDAFVLDPSVSFLNHGSFGACPRRVLERQHELRNELEREPVHFFLRRFEPLLDEARHALARFVGADPEGLAFVHNATTGVNTVLRSFPFAPGDEILASTHGYAASNNAAAYIAERTGARLVTAEIPFPLTSDDEIVRAIDAAITPRTRFLLVDHVTTPTGLVFPVARTASRCEDRGIAVMVDGAHAPGMLDLDVAALGASFYTGNCHKWLCAPKGAAFLWARRDRLENLRPLAISHGATADTKKRSRFRLEFDWTGTDDPTAFLTVPFAIGFLDELITGGWPALRATLRERTLEARRVLASRLDIPLPCPDSMIGTLAAFPLPDDTRDDANFRGADPLRDELFDRHAIEVPVFPWPRPPARCLRIAVHLYNELAEYERLADVLATLLARR